MANLYSGRRAKTVQRRMIVDACRRLTGVAPLEEYQYVGFGGLEFNDFIEFHNALGLRNMTSIEHDTMLTHRVAFNKPYANMDVRMGEARDELAQLDWTRLTVTWLDYVDPLSRDILRDVEYVVRSSMPGSVVLVTVQCDLGKSLGTRLEGLHANLQELCPPGLTEEDVQGWGVAAIQRDALQTTANSVAREAHNGTFRQQFNFTYADGARMLTWGGIVSAPNVDRAISDCRFEDLPFVRSGELSLHIRIPDFTEREWLHFEREVQTADGGASAVKGVNKDDVLAFAQVYRWKAS